MQRKSVSHPLSRLLEQRGLNVRDLVTTTNLSQTDLEDYISGKKNMPPEAQTNIAAALKISIWELSYPLSLPPPWTKYEMMEVFMETLHEFERRASHIELEPGQYQALLKNVEKLGGWKALLELTNKEIFESTQREASFQRERKTLLKKALPSKPKVSRKAEVG